MRWWVVVALVACKTTGASGDAGPAPELAMATQAPKPSNASPDFKVGDDVVYLRDDGTFELEADVVEAAANIFFVDSSSKVTNAPGQRLAATGWQPSDAGTTRGYKLHTGSGRFSKTEWIPAAQIFPVPWLAAPKAGDVFYERRFGDFKSPKCTVTEPPTSPRGDVKATCEGDTRPRWVKRNDAVAVFRPPTVAELKPGDVVYARKMYWAMVVGTQEGRVIIREAGFGTKDKAVLPSTLEAVR